MKIKYQVIGWDNDTENHELVGIFNTKDEAELVLFQCQEGDDKHAPLDYQIVEELCE